MRLLVENGRNSSVTTVLYTRSPSWLSQMTSVVGTGESQRGKLMADQKYRYICERNHEIVSATPIKKCLAMIKGKPCPGKLRSVGKGSRSKKDEDE